MKLSIPNCQPDDNLGSKYLSITTVGNTRRPNYQLTAKGT